MADEEKVVGAAAPGVSGGGVSAAEDTVGSSPSDDVWFLKSSVIGPPDDVEKEKNGTTYTVKQNSQSSFKFGGMEGIVNGVCNIEACSECGKGYLDILKNAQKELVELFKTQTGFTGDVNNESETKSKFKEWCQIFTIAGQANRDSPTSKHFKGHAVDINYEGTPYIPMRAASSETMNGEGHSNVTDVQGRIWNVAREIYDRAMGLYYGLPLPTTIVPRSRAEYAYFDLTYKNLQRLHWSLRFYFNYMYGFAHLKENPDSAHLTATNTDPFAGADGQAQACLDAMINDLDNGKLHPGAKIVFSDDLRAKFSEAPVEVTISGCKSLKTADAGKYNTTAGYVAHQIAMDHDYLKPSMVVGSCGDKNSSGKGTAGLSTTNRWRDPCLGVLNINYDMVNSIFRQTYKGSTHPRWAMWNAASGADIMHIDVSVGAGTSPPPSLDVDETVKMLSGLPMDSMLAKINTYTKSQIESLIDGYNATIKGKYGERVYIALKTMLLVKNNKHKIAAEQNTILDNIQYQILTINQKNCIREKLVLEKYVDPALECIITKDYETFWSEVQGRSMPHLLSTLGSMSSADLDAAYIAYIIQSLYGVRPELAAMAVLDRYKGWGARVLTDAELKPYMESDEYAEPKPLPKDQRNAIRLIIGVPQEP